MRTRGVTVGTGGVTVGTRRAASRPRAAAAASAAVTAALLLLVAAALAGAPAYAAVNAWLDSTQTAPGESVQLTLEHDGETSSQPDLAPLERDFNVLGTNRTTSVQIVNGSASSKSEVSITLTPKHAGRLTIPSLTWDGERSPSLVLNVAPGAGGRGGAAGMASPDRQVFVQMQFSPPRPYVQAAVHVTLRLYTREALYDPSVSFAPTSDALIQRVGKDVDSSVEKGGETYEVVTRHYLVFPQRSGSIELPGPVLNAKVAVGGRANAAFNNPFAGFFGPMPFGNMLTTVRPIRLSSGTISLDVKPRPPGAGASYWLPASGVTLHATWQPAALRAQAGDPVTLDLTLQAEGLTAAQLPDLSQLLQLPQGVKAYPDEPKLTNASQGDDVIGTRRQSIALIADHPGRFTIPALTVKWWDTATNRAREAMLPKRTLVVLPAQGAGSAAGAGSASGSGSAVRLAVAPAAAAANAGAAQAPRTNPALAGNAGGGGSGAPGPSGGSLGWHFPAKGSMWLWVSAALAFAWLATVAAWVGMRVRMRWRAAGQAPAVDSSGLAATAGAAALAVRERADRSAEASVPARRAAVGGATASGVPASAAASIAAAAKRSSGSRMAFRAACARNDAAGARRHLLAWVAAEWPSPAPGGLNALAREVGDAQLAELLRELDRACYADEPWQGGPLVAALEKLPARKRDPHNRSASIASLYP